MSFESFTGVLASVMGVVMAMAPLLQARRVRALRDSSEVSVGFFAIIITGSVVWCLRGFVTLDLVLIVPNVVAFVVELVTLLVVLRYRQGVPPAVVAAALPAPSASAVAASSACPPAATTLSRGTAAARRRLRRVAVRR